MDVEEADSEEDAEIAVFGVESRLKKFRIRGEGD